MNGRCVVGPVLVAALLLGGCSQSAKAPAGDAKDTASAGKAAPAADQSRGKATYAALTPESAAEKDAVANVGKVYAQYLAGAEAAAKQSPATVVYRDGGKVKPLFIGYRVVAYSAKKANGKYDTASVLVLGGTVTAEAGWEKAGELTLSDIRPEYFAYETPAIFQQALSATTPREKEAVAKAKAWLEKNFAAKGFDRFELAGYTFTYGQPNDEHGLLLHVGADGGSYGATAR